MELDNAGVTLKELNAGARLGLYGQLWRREYSDNSLRACISAGDGGWSLIMCLGSLFLLFRREEVGSEIIKGKTCITLLFQNRIIIIKFSFTFKVKSIQLYQIIWKIFQRFGWILWSHFFFSNSMWWKLKSLLSGFAF